MSKFSENLKELMIEKDINAPALAKELGIAPTTVCNYLRGTEIPYLSVLTLIADYFQCPTDYLLGLIEHWEIKSYKKRPNFSDRLSFLLQRAQITKYRLEKDTGFTEKTVNRWHNGKTEPSAESLIRLAKYFECSVDFIIGREI